MLGKREWINIHWNQASAKYHQKIGIQPHNGTWKDIGWRWTPKVCLCEQPHMLRTDQATRLGQT